MTRFLLAPAVAFAVSVAARADDPKKADPPKPPDAAQKADDKKEDTRPAPEKFREAKAAMDASEKAFRKAIDVVREKGEQPSLKDPDIKKNYEAMNAARVEVNKYALATAKADPKSKDGADALFFVAESTRPGTKDAESIFALVIEHHVSDKRLAGILNGWSYMPVDEATGKSLEMVISKSKDDTVVAVAKFVRGKVLLRSKDTSAEGEKLLEAVAAMSPDLKILDRSIAKFAAGELYEFKFLSEGKTVPEIDGEDVEGSKIKISDYRGKVVMLDFWGHW